MSGAALAAIVRALGGELYADGRRANVPAPGHSAADRSVSLLLSGDRVIVHAFGATDWRTVLDDLRVRGLVDAAGRLAGGSGAAATTAFVMPTRTERRAGAERLWESAGPVMGTLSEAYCRRRGVKRDLPSELRHHPAAPAAVYAGRGPFRPALLAAVRDLAGALCAVELSYLAGADTCSARRLSRKTVGVLPVGHAVRIDAAAERLLVAEGVFSALSAAERFGRPAWALGAADALAAWSPPAEVLSVLVAADRGEAGEGAATRLAARLRQAGRAVEVVVPPAPFGDWSDAAQAEEK